MTIKVFNLFLVVSGVCQRVCFKKGPLVCPGQPRAGEEAEEEEEERWGLSGQGRRLDPLLFSTASVFMFAALPETTRTVNSFQLKQIDSNVRVSLSWHVYMG